PLMALMAELMMPITALMGALTRPTIPLQMVPKMLVTLDHAALQLPVNTLTMKSMMFCRMVMSPWKAGVMNWIKAVMGGMANSTMLIIAVPTAVMRDPITGKIDCTNGDAAAKKFPKAVATTCTTSPSVEKLIWTSPHKPSTNGAIASDTV